MRLNLYANVVLTIIAACLIALMWSSGPRAVLGAQTRTHCHGEMKATSSGLGQAAVGASYHIDVSCE